MYCNMQFCLRSVAATFDMFSVLKLSIINTTIESLEYRFKLSTFQSWLLVITVYAIFGHTQMSLFWNVCCSAEYWRINVWKRGFLFFGLQTLAYHLSFEFKYQIWQRILTCGVRIFKNGSNFSQSLWIPGAYST